MNLKKLHSYLLMALVLIIVFNTIGCKNEKETTSVSVTEESTGDVANGFDLTPDSKNIVVWQFSNDPEDVVVTAFIRKFPEFKVDNSTAVTAGFWPDKSADLPNLAGAIASNTQPDLFLCSTYSPIEAFYSDLFQPLDDFFTHDPDYNFETIDSITFDLVTFNEKVYFAPKAITASTLLWDKDIFESVGLDPEIPPSNWSELLEYNEKLLTYDSTGAIKTIGMKNLVGSFMEWNIRAFGEHYTDNSGLSINLDTENQNNTIEFLSSLNAINGNNATLPEGVYPAMNQWNIGAFSLYSGFNKSENYGITIFPKPDNQSEEYIPYSVINFYGIPKKAKNPKGGWKLLKFTHTDAVYDDQVRWYNLGPDTFVPDYIAHIPTREKLYKELKPVVDEDKWEIAEKRDEIVSKVNMPKYDLAVSCEFSNYLRDEVAKVAENKISPKEFLKNAQDYGNALLKSFIDRKKSEKWVINDDDTAIPPNGE